MTTRRPPPPPAERLHDRFRRIENDGGAARNRTVAAFGEFLQRGQGRLARLGIGTHIERLENAHGTGHNLETFRFGRYDDFFDNRLAAGD